MRRVDRFGMTWLLGSAAAVALITTGASLPQAQAAGQAGVASAVLPAAQGTPLDQSTRVLQVGIDVFQQERIETGPEGKTQMLMLDGSALTVGPNSDIKIDEFVYDPDAKTGKIAMSATKGLFRLVGGRISKKTPMTLKTPTATIGIRGGIALISVTPTLTTGVFVFGDQMTMSAGGVQKATQRPGSQMQAADPNAPPSDPAPVTSLGDTLTALEGSGASDGGAGDNKPTDNDVASSQVSELGSQNDPGAVAPAGPAGPGGGDRGGENAQQSDSKAKVQNAQQNQVTDTTAGVTGGQRNTGISTSLTYKGRSISNPPFTGYDFDTSRANFNTSKVFSFTDGAISGGKFTASSGSTSFSLPATQKGSSFTFGSDGTSSGAGEVSGTGFISSDDQFAYFTLKEAGASNNPASLFGGNPFTGSFPTSGIAAYTLNPGFPGDYSIPFIDASFGGNLNSETGAISSISPFFIAHSPNLASFPDDKRSVTAFGAVVIVGTGSSQKSVMVGYTGSAFDVSGDEGVALGGFTRGTARLAASNSIHRSGIGGTSVPLDGVNNFAGTTTPDYFVLDANFFDSGSVARSSQTGAGFNQTLENTSVDQKTYFQEQYATKQDLPSGIGTSRTTRTRNGYTGLVMDQRITGTTVSQEVYQNKNNLPTSFTLSTNATTNRASAQMMISSSSYDQTLNFGGLTGSNQGRSAFIDDDTFAMRESPNQTSTVNTSGSTANSNNFRQRSVLLSDTFLSGFNNTLPGSSSICSCTFLNFGFWNLDNRPNSGGNPRFRAHLAPFVAGDLPSASDIPSTGTASFTGNTVVNVHNGTSQYISASDFNLTYNFANPTATTATINNLDGASFTTTSAGLNGGNPNFFVNISSSATGRSGSIHASFFKSSTDNTAGVGGGIKITGTDYEAGGIVMGQKN